jgi:HAD superfamily hydrolase (TIGR01509 family)
VEDDFCNGRPPLELVGVELVADVRPYEVMKTRMLNGAHSALGHLAALAGFETTDQAMADPVVRGYVEGFLAEVAQGLLEVPGVDLDAYAATLVERFSNPRISDQISRLCRRSTTKVPGYVFPSLHRALDHDLPRAHLVLAVAAWLRYLRGEDYVGADLEVQDVHADRLREIARSAGNDPRPLLAQADVFGSLAGDERLAAELEPALAALQAGPLEAVVAFTGRRAGTRARRVAGRSPRGRRGVHRRSRRAGRVSVAQRPLTGVRVVLCDADGNLFPSEEPAFVASTEVTNRFLAERGVARRYGPEELRLATTGMNFRSTIVALTREHGLPPLSPDELEHWVQAEKEAVTVYLREALQPDPDVLGPLTTLAQHHGLAAVSSSADARISACFEVTGMARFFPAARRFSAEDSLPVPTSKPDPAVYLHALHALGVEAEQAVAVEDSIAGATSAVAAAIPTIGNLQFVQPGEREERHRLLDEAGVLAVVTSWAEVVDLLA